MKIYFSQTSSGSCILCSFVGLLDKGLVVALQCGGWIEVAKITGSVHWMQIGSISTVLHFHTCVLAEINIISPCFIFLKVVLNPHEHIECLVGLFLTVFDAFHFRFVRWSGKIEVYTVFVALLE